MTNTATDLLFLATYLAVWLFLVTRAAWVSAEISIKCVGASRSFPLPFLLSLCAPDRTESIQDTNTGVWGIAKTRNDLTPSNVSTTEGS